MLVLRYYRYFLTSSANNTFSIPQNQKFCITFAASIILRGALAEIIPFEPEQVMLLREVFAIRFFLHPLVCGLFSKK